MQFFYVHICVRAMQKRFAFVSSYNNIRSAMTLKYFFPVIFRVSS